MSRQSKFTPQQFNTETPDNFKSMTFPSWRVEGDFFHVFPYDSGVDNQRNISFISTTNRNIQKVKLFRRWDGSFYLYFCSYPESSKTIRTELINSSLEIDVSVYMIFDSCHYCTPCFLSVQNPFLRRFLIFLLD